MDKILPHLPKDLPLEPHHLMAISVAFDDVCKALKLAATTTRQGDNRRTHRRTCAAWRA